MASPTGFDKERSDEEPCGPSNIKYGEVARWPRGNPPSKNHAADAAIKIKAAREAGKFIFQAEQDGFIVIL